MKILITVVGCDDSTESIMEVNEKELQTLIKFAKINNKNSKYSCQPNIFIYDKFEKFKYDWEDEEENFHYEYGKDLVEED